jgi:thioesterase domain-containing protein
MPDSIEPTDLLGLADAAATTLDIESFLHRNIPVTLAFGIRVVSADEDGVRLRAPLEPNLNVRGTAFAGSIASLAILSGWIWLFLDLRRHALHYRPVVRRHSMEYLMPLSGPFDAVCQAPARSTAAMFRQDLIERGRARLWLESSVFNSQSDLAASAKGEYVVMA